MRNAPMVLVTILIAGCLQSPANPLGGPPPQPEVDVCRPKVEMVRDFEDFPGRIEAINSVEVRARVTGYLEKVHFREGEEVKKGDLLFEIDPRTYKAAFDLNKAKVIDSEATVKLAEQHAQRAETLAASKNASIAQAELDQVRAQLLQATAGLEQAKANLETARLNLDWTKVRAALDGKISRRMVDPGNLVKADDTVLTTIVSVDSVYAYFDLDERSTLRAKRLIRDGKIKWSFDSELPVWMGLADETGFPHRGTIDFADNRMDPDSGTWRIRARFKNPQNTLLPGLFVRMRFPIGEPYQALLVAEQTLGTDQGQKFVYVVEDGGKVAYRRVKVGRLYEGLRVITEGITATDKVVITGLQRIRPGVDVTETLLKEMPALTDAK
jgi:RND family efflux transporter MFP subunit